MENTRARNSLLLVTVGFTAAVCLAVLVNIEMYADKLTDTFVPEPQIISARRGSIYDRNGILLAGTDKNGSRTYPLSVAPHIIGTLSSDGSAQSGIELALDEQLSGRDGYTDGRLIQPAVNGADVYLTIDHRLQSAAENMLRTAAANYANGVDYATYAPYCGSAGAAVIVSCKNGEVLASASYPDLSLADFAEDYDRLAADERSPLLDRVSRGLYRPGSTLKTVTACAALSTGAVRADTAFWCGAHMQLGGISFSCMNSHGYTDIRKALEVSCNIFFYRTALSLGIDSLLEYEHLFGLGEAPDYELPALSGQLASPDTLDHWSSGQLIQAAIGQSAAECTPLQLAAAALTLANNGRRYAPSAVLGVGTRGNSQTSQKEPQAEFSRPEVFEVIRDGMVASTKYTYGDYALSQLPEPAAIKTGTPESPRGYDSLVIGYYPANDPEIAFAVILEGGANAKHSVYELINAYNHGGRPVPPK